MRKRSVKVWHVYTSGLFMPLDYSKYFVGDKNKQYAQYSNQYSSISFVKFVLKCSHLQKEVGEI